MSTYTRTSNGMNMFARFVSPFIALSWRILNKVKNFADYRLRKHLVESLILSKLDYCDTVFYPLPDFLVKRLQRVQFAAASFVEGRYVNDVKVELGE